MPITHDTDTMLVDVEVKMRDITNALLHPRRSRSTQLVVL